MIRIALLASALMLTGCGSLRSAEPCAQYGHGYDLEVRRACFLERVREIAGEGVTVCGTMKAQPPNPIVLNCAMSRFEAGRPFLMIEWVPGIDSDLANAWMLRSDGSFCLVRYDDHWAEAVETAMRPLACGTAEVVYVYGRYFFDFKPEASK